MITEKYTCDILIIGCGVIGLATGIAILESRPKTKVIVVDKEHHPGRHASGRNSGVIHAGFYYSPNSLKAKFCREGNLEIRQLAKKHSVVVNEIGKVVVARDEDENTRLDDLLNRGIQNGVDLEIYSEGKLPEYEPLAVTKERFLWSPKTAVSDPMQIIKAMLTEFTNLGGVVHFGRKVNLELKNNEVIDKSCLYNFKHVINAAGSHSNYISNQIGVGSKYSIVPFMGLYRTTQKKQLPLTRLVYPVPHQINPFLGVHFTVSVDGAIKLGPTAIPIFGREQYTLLTGWSVKDTRESFQGFYSLIKGETHKFSEIISTEVPKFFEPLLVKESALLVPSARQVKTWKIKPPGIRSQLVERSTGRLEQDFIIENHLNSTHVLNAVSPGWTCSLPFGRYVVQKFKMD